MPIPVADRGKNPLRPAWQHSTLETPLTDFPQQCNIGVLLGTPSGGLVDIDLDCPEAIAAAPYLLPPTGLKFGRQSKPDSHWIYVVEECGKSERWKSKHGVLLEYRANGAQTVFPPSTHQTGEIVEFSCFGDPNPIPRTELLSAVEKLRACSLLAQNWTPGNRHDLVLALVGTLLRAGWMEADIAPFVHAICAAANDDELEDRLRSIADTAKRIQDGDATTGFNALVKLVGANDGKQLKSWLHIASSSSTGAAQGTDPKADDDLRFTDLGNVERFVQQNQDDVAYCHGLDTWMTWQDGRWLQDDAKQIVNLASQTAQSIYGEVEGIQRHDERERMKKWASRSCSKGLIQSMLSLAESRLGVRHTELDQNRWLLNFKNGTLDLRSGTLHPHQRNDWITKLIPFDYDARADCPRFKKFMGEITGSNSQLTEFIQRALGYSLTGVTDEQCLFIAHGEGANGKSTLLNLFRDLLAGYAVNTPVHTFLAKKHDSGTSNDLVRLRGARFVTASEAEANQRLAESLLKRFTGGDPITARGLYKEFIEFTPNFKLWWATNHKPKIAGDDPALSRRIHLIPFDFVIPEKDRDPELPNKLKAEAQGILAWAVKGCLDWKTNRLNPPPVVTNATTTYLNEMDDVRQFLSDCVKKLPFGNVPKGEMFEAYTRWSKDNGGQSLTKNALGARLKKLEYQDGKNNGQRFWQDVRLIGSDLAESQTPPDFSGHRDTRDT